MVLFKVLCKHFVTVVLMNTRKLFRSFQMADIVLCMVTQNNKRTWVLPMGCCTCVNHRRERPQWYSESADPKISISTPTVVKLCKTTVISMLFFECRIKEDNPFFIFFIEHYKHHWFPEKPCKGSGYRCIRINHKMDPLIGQAAQRIGLSSQELFQLLPSELTLWVDPYEVSYRIGEDGSICVLYEAAPAGGSQNNTNMQMVDSRISCKEELLLGRTSPSKSYNMMTVSG